jgi:hypothetical protein
MKLLTIAIEMIVSPGSRSLVCFVQVDPELLGSSATLVVILYKELRVDTGKVIGESALKLGPTIKISSLSPPPSNI